MRVELSRSDHPVRPAPHVLRLGSLAGVVAPILCATIFAVAAWLRPGYGPIRQYGSELALGQDGWLQTSNFIAVSLLLICFAVASQRDPRGGPQARLGPVLVGWYGLGWVLAGMFHGHLHQLATYLFVALPLACLAIAPRLAGDAQWKGSVGLSLGFGFLGLVFSAGWYVDLIHVLIPGVDSWIGLYQRLFYAEILAWIEIMTLDLLALASRGAGPRPALPLRLDLSPSETASHR